MGYTHYWKQSRDFTTEEWTELTALAQRVVDASRKAGVPLVYEYDQLIPAQIDSDRIRFNGIAGDGHETFVLTRKKRERYEYEKGTADLDDAEIAARFSFCKTACKPYDVAVVAILIAASDYAALEWSSDGETADHDAGRRLLIDCTTVAVQPPAVGGT